MGVTEVIKYEGENDTLVWKYPLEDFNTETQLIVHESQEAVFFLNGQALDSFRRGRYTLETENIPLLKKVLNLVTGDKTPFHAEVYFINLTEKMDLQWGTDSKISYCDPTYNNYPYKIGAHGSMSFSVSNGRKLLFKLVGTESILDNQKLLGYFKGAIKAYVKSYLPKVLKENEISIFDLDEHLIEFSNNLKATLQHEFDDYGVKLDKFWIEEFTKPEDDPIYIKRKALLGEKVIAPEKARIQRETELIEKSTEQEKKKMDIDVKAYEQKHLGYEDILKEDNSDAEAHWGLVLSKYGIEYVTDPKTQEKIPTCHRTQEKSILADSDYLAAIEYSDVDTRRIIEKRAEFINEIQSKILQISKKEPPYDIFICYKETDENGEKTEDSVLAQDLYYQLVKQGYKVFFAKKTLEGKLGAEYEPVIFAALSSAKVMIVLGLKKEHFEAVWVRNEWSRFSEMSKGTDKVIIPAYRDISPYELPVELSSLQAQDMSKIGFMQDLLDGIERCLHKKSEPTESAASKTLERLLKNGETFLKLKNFSKAEETYKTVTEDYPEDYHGWWGLIICKTREFSEIEVDQLEINVWYEYIRQLAEPEEFKEVEKTYIEYCRKYAMLDAEKDIRAVNAKIDAYNREIDRIEQKIKKAEAEIVSTQKALEFCKEAKDFVNMQNAIVSKEEHQKENKSLVMLAGLGLVILGIFGVVNSNLLMLFGVAGVIVLGYATVKYESFSEIEKQAEDAQADLESKSKSDVKRIEQYNKNIDSLNAQIVEYQNEIVSIRERITDCQKYLEFGKEQIATLWLAKIGQSFGANPEFDIKILDYRQKVFETEKL